MANLTGVSSSTSVHPLGLGLAMSLYLGSVKSFGGTYSMIPWNIGMLLIDENAFTNSSVETQPKVKLSNY